MKRVGLLGGMSWTATAVYYEGLNREVQRRLGGSHSADIVLRTVDFGRYVAWQREGRWNIIADSLGREARALEAAGVECVVICTNTMHKFAAEVETELSVPLLHIGTATGMCLAHAGVDVVGLLGARFTMEDRFLHDHLATGFGIRTVVPPEDQRAEVHRVIYEELCMGAIRESSRIAFAGIIRGLAARGVDAVVLGCTEIGLLVGAEGSRVPTFDTTSIHVRAVTDYMLDGTLPRARIAGVGAALVNCSPTFYAARQAERWRMGIRCWRGVIPI